MKIIQHAFTLFVFLAAFAAATPVFGQDVCSDIDTNLALYARYTENYSGTLEQKEIAIAAGKQYIQKYSSCKDFDAQVNYLKKAVPKLEEDVVKIKEDNNTRARYQRFNAALTAEKADEIYASGREILKYEPDKLDVIIVLAIVGLDEVADNNNNTYNSDAIAYAKSAIRKLPDAPEARDYGVLQYSYPTKEDALGWLNYTIGYIMYYGQKNKDAALPYFHEATQHDSKAKDRYFIYELIGDIYRDKAINLGEEIVKKLEDGETYETKMMFAVQKGYAERVIDAYARAYTIGKAAKPAPKPEYLDNLKGSLETFYRFRFVKDDDPSRDVSAEVMEYVESVLARPFPNPSSVVQPVDPPDQKRE